MQVYSKCNSDKIWHIAWINLVATFYALMTPNWREFPIPLIGFVTSLLHWKDPIEGSLRQQIDMLVVKLTGLYQLYRAYGAQYMKPYYLLFACGLVSYYMGCRYYEESTYHISCYCHMGVHIFVGISNIILYSGYIPPLIIFP
jgi:hypothetical protein